jgi:hypothetical protein
MTDEGTPPGPPKFPPVDDPRWPPPADGPPGYPPPGYGPPGFGGYGPPGWSPGPRHWLHPLDVGRAFSSAFRLYRLKWQAMVGAMAIIYLPALLLYTLVEVFVVGPAMTAWMGDYLAALQRRDFAELPLPPAVLLLSFVGALVVGVFSVLSTAAVVHVADASYKGGSATAGQAVRAALARTGSLIGVALATFLGVLLVTFVGALATVLLALLAAVIGGVGLGVFAGLIGGVGTLAAVIFVTLRWSMGIQSVMCEGTGALAAMGRSWRLISGSTWRVLGYYLLVFVIAALIGLAVGAVMLLVFRPTLDIGTNTGPFVSPVTMSPAGLLAQTLVGGLVSLMFTPWWLTVLTLLYYDLRWRRGELQPTPTAAQDPALIG